MFKDEFKAVCNSAAAKLNLMKSNPMGYFVASILAVSYTHLTLPTKLEV